MLQIQKHNRSLYKYVGWPIARLCLTFMTMLAVYTFCCAIQDPADLDFIIRRLTEIFCYAWIVAFASMWFENYVPDKAKSFALPQRFVFLVAAVAVFEIVGLMLSGCFHPGSDLDALAIMAGVLTPIGVFGFMWTADHGEQLLLSDNGDNLLH